MITGMIRTGITSLTLVSALASADVSGVAPATTNRSGKEIASTICATCHAKGDVPRAPHFVQFPMIGPRGILEALETGAMRSQGAMLTAAERRAVAEYLGESSLSGSEAHPIVRCTGAALKFDFGRPPALNGWGMTRENTRFIAEPGIKADDIPRLAVKWAFAIPGATRSRSQPTVGGGALFFGGQDGTVYALDLDTGCARWNFKADAEIRSSPTLESWKAGDTHAHPHLYLGDFVGNAYALDAVTGTLVWKTHVDSHPMVTLTGSPKLFEGRLYVPMSSNEWASAANPTYECCTFRGGVAALNARTGRLIWRSYAIPKAPMATGERNSAGALRYAPAGAPIWNSPSIDAKRRRLYVGSGEAYTSPAAPQSDSVLAFDLDTGKQVWFYQSLAHDAWNMSCFIGGGPNCPLENGPDLDIGASVALHRLPNGREIILAGQKSSDAFALDLDGKVLWKRRLGRGGVVGGIHWGIAVSPDTLYAPIADTTVLGTEKGERKPGIYALEPATGAIKWFAPAPDVCPPEKKPACDPGYSAPPTAIPGAVFVGSFDGWMRAYRESDGALLWSFDTTRSFNTVSGDTAHGGAIESAGPVITEGRVIASSGYLFGGRMAGNVVLMLSVDGK